MSQPANLVNLERVSHSYGIRMLLDEVSLGVGVGQRIGVVGRNGDGKSTLLDIVAGTTEPQEGRVSRSRGIRVEHLVQGDPLAQHETVRDIVLQGRAEHEWAADRTTREVVEVLLAGIELDRLVDGLSGGERRRCSLARLLLEEQGLTDADVAHVLLAGSFGSYLAPASAVRIGPVPDVSVLRIVSAGNVAGEGAKMALLSVRERAAATALLEGVHYVELSDRADFNDRFVDQLSFPSG